MVVVAVEEILLLLAVELVDENGGDADEVASGDAVLEPAEGGRRGEFGAYAKKTRHSCATDKAPPMAVNAVRHPREALRIDAREPVEDN